MRNIEALTMKKMNRYGQAASLSRQRRPAAKHARCRINARGVQVIKASQIFKGFLRRRYP